MATKTVRKPAARSRTKKATSSNGSQRGNGRSGNSREKEVRRVDAHPKPPMPKQHQEYPALEAKVHPRPQYKSPLY